MHRNGIINMKKRLILFEDVMKAEKYAKEYYEYSKNMENYQLMWRLKQIPQKIK